MGNVDLHPDGARISVLTRTLGHGPFLRRSLASIERAAHLYEIEWIIVDDEPKGVDEPLQRFCDEVRSRGRLSPRLVRSRAGHRALAANEGLQVATGDYVHFHDDDDTVCPDFYRELVTMLQSDPRPGAAAARCERIVERLCNSEEYGYAIVEQSLHYPEVTAVTLASQAVSQTIPPISILFRRDALASVGEFDPAFEVGEDYELLLRFLQQRDIALSDRILARFHQRLDTASPAGNSRITTHFATEIAYFRNAMLRRDLAGGRIGLGWLLAFGELMSGSVKTERILSQFYKNRLAKSLFSRLRRL
jgi:glycosyltransferase involved in cell wall biosynthesis